MSIKKVKNRVPWLMLIGAVFVFLGGILVWFLPDSVMEVLIVLIAIGLLVIYGAVRGFQLLREDKLTRSIVAVSVCWTAAMMLVTLDFSLDAVAVMPSIIVGVVSLILGLIRAMICVNSFMNHFAGGVRNGISALLCLGFGVALLIHPIGNFAVMTFVLGFYMIFYSITIFGDAFAAMFHTDLKDDRRKRRNHFATPNLITAVKPSQMIASINRRINDGKLEHGMLIEEKKKTEFDHVNLEIMVHLTTQGANKFGHVDIAVGETIFSYGTYDSSKTKYAGFVSQGTLIEVPKMPYLKYCLDYQKKYVIGFGACLSDSQLETIKNRIEGFKKEYCEPLESEYECALRENRDGSEYSDPASNIVRDVGGKVYTVVSGPYKRYFGININCVQFADWLLNDSGIDAISFSGLRTPGAYYDMLDNMLRRKNTRVIRRIYYILSDDIRHIEKLGDTSALSEKVGAEA